MCGRVVFRVRKTCTRLRRTRRKFEIGRILHLKSEIRDLKLNGGARPRRVDPLNKNSPRGGGRNLGRGMRFLRTPGLDPTLRTAPRRGVEESSHSPRGANVDPCSFQGYAKNASPWLLSEHASGVRAVQFKISDFGFEMQDSSNFEIFFKESSSIHRSRPECSAPTAGCAPVLT